MASEEEAAASGTNIHGASSSGSKDGEYLQALTHQPIPQQPQISGEQRMHEPITYMQMPELRGMGLQEGVPTTAANQEMPQLRGMSPREATHDLDHTQEDQLKLTSISNNPYTKYPKTIWAFIGALVAAGCVTTFYFFGKKQPTNTSEEEIDSKEQ